MNVRMWYNSGGRDVPIDVVEGTPLVLRYYGDTKFGRFVSIDTVGRGRWKHTVIRAKAPDGSEFTGGLFWFAPVVTPEDSEALRALEASNGQA